MNKKIDVIYFHEGGGHYNTALAIEDCLSKHCYDVSLIDIADIYEITDEEDFDKTRLASLYALDERSQFVLIEKFYKNREVDLVISVVSTFNRALCKAVKRVNNNTIFVTLVTDLSDGEGALFIREGLDQHLILGSDSLVNKALEKRYSSDRIHKVNGIIVNKKFYSEVDKTALKVSKGFQEKDVIGLVMFSGAKKKAPFHLLDTWKKAMLHISKELSDRPMIFICGSDKATFDVLSEKRSSVNHLILGHVNNVHEYMSISDFYLGKPGSGAVHEAIVSKLPMVIANIGMYLRQETIGFDYVRDKQLGLAVSNFDNVRKYVDTICKDRDLYIANINKEKITAVFELPSVIGEIFDFCRF